MNTASAPENTHLKGFNATVKCCRITLKEAASNTKAITHKWDRSFHSSIAGGNVLKM